MKSKLTIQMLAQEAKSFCLAESTRPNKKLFGTTDGKAIGTYIEHTFQTHLIGCYDVLIGSSASGIDLPSDDICTDIKVTSIRQPQSSCPFKDAKQKIYGLGYNVLLFVYDKTDDPRTETATLNFVHCVFIHKERTADYTTTFRLREMVRDNSNVEDIVAYLSDRNLPADEVLLYQIAEQIIESPPEQGYLTISNALQWRLQYQRVVTLEEHIKGIDKLISTGNK